MYSRTVRNKDEERQAEVVHYKHSFHVKSTWNPRGVFVGYRQFMRRDHEYVGIRVTEMELSGKQKRGRPKRRFLDVVKKDMGKVGAREKDIENTTLWRNMIRCGYP